MPTPKASDGRPKQGAVGEEQVDMLTP